MSNSKPNLPKGTRDFSPLEMVKRNYIFDTIKGVFKKYGYAEIQTPSMENLNTLTGKYGDEGDKLIFKILNSGDYFKNVESAKIKQPEFELNSKNLLPIISEKALRYDLTVPFARYVVMHQNDITFPFKRFQMQPVWRADRPQRGRYREFYQCDADVVGSDSLLNEAEFVMIYHEALSLLGLKDFDIKINNRKILSGIAELIGKPDLMMDMTIAIDKLDKIGFEGVEKELLERGFTSTDIEKLMPIIELSGENHDKLEQLKNVLSVSTIGLKGVAELERVMHLVEMMNPESRSPSLQLDITLARGLNYYTGCIFEVKTNEVAMGSIGGGGRYDDLTGMFGLKNLTGVGISFGADRIYDVLEELNLFPTESRIGTKALICNFGSDAELTSIKLMQNLRSNGVSVELYPHDAKLKKQLSYADDKNIPYAIFIGEEELKTNTLTLKNMTTGDQSSFSPSEIMDYLIKN